MLYLCVTLAQSAIGRQCSVGFGLEAFEVTSRELLAEATALPGGEWHHGIRRSGSVQPARFWMTGDVNAYMQSCLRPKEQFVLRELWLPTHTEKTKNKKRKLKKNTT